MKTPDDIKESIQNYLKGDKDVFETIYKLSYAYLHTCVIHVMKDEDAAQDILQETYIEIAKNMEQLRDPESFMAWAAMIANRKCFAALKQKNREILTPDGEDPENFFENIADTPVLGVLVSAGNVFTIIVISNMTYERTLPGGKFFRSLKDGFNVYGKMRLALMISIFFIISIYTAIVYILDRAVFHFMANGSAVYISVFTFSLLAIGITNLTQMIKKNKARLVFGGMIFLLFIISGALTIVSGNDNIGIVHIIAAVLAVVLIPVSHKLMLADYRKNRWNA